MENQLTNEETGALYLQCSLIDFIKSNPYLLKINTEELLNKFHEQH